MINVGVVGLGTLGTWHATTVQRKTHNATLAAICGRRQASIDRFIETNGPVEFTYTNYDEMLANDVINAILVVTPVATHRDMVVQALEHGKHVFVEKPLGLTPEDARAAQIAADARPGLVLTTGYMRRYDVSYAEAKRKIERGEIGQPIVLRAYSLDLDAAPESSPERGEANGAWYSEMLVHDVDLMRWLMGAEVTTIRTIGGCYKHKEFERFRDVDNACTLMSLTNGAMAMYYTGRTAPHGCHIETEIIGTEGFLRINPVPARDRITIYDASGVRSECYPDYIARFEDAFVTEIQEFIDCIAEHKKPQATPFDARMATEIADAAYRAYLSGEIIEL